MSTELQTTNKPTGLRVWLDKPEVHKQLAAAVGDVMDVDTFIAHVMVAFQDEKVRRCSDQSKYVTLHELAAMGLLPTLGQVVLIPYKDQIKAMPQWQGLKALMERNSDILEVTGHLVHHTDTFAIVNGEVNHTYDPFDTEREISGPTDIRGGYCKIVYRDGRPPKYHFVTVKTISKAQKCAQTQNIWTAWYEQMAMKTLYRDCYARRAVPMDPLVQTRMERALDIDNLNLGNDPSRVLPDATERHIEQARQQRLDQEPPGTPPEPLEPDQPVETPEADEGQGEPYWPFSGVDLGDLWDKMTPGYMLKIKQATDLDAVVKVRISAKNNAILADDSRKAIVGACDRIIAAETED